jgi:Na+-translocating ferredoxin:NAD+ oxidoreductase RnfG subunit
MRTRFPLAAGLLLATLVAAAPAAAAEYWKPGDLLRDFFKTSQAVHPKSVTLPEADALAIAKKLGLAPDKLRRTWSVYIAEADGKRTGYALLDSEIGLHEAIDFGVRFRLDGAVDRVEILVYREPFGDEVRGERFRRQFVGKTANDSITAGQDIDIVSGATYSSKSMALGVKRDALVLQAVLKNGL